MDVKDNGLLFTLLAVGAVAGAKAVKDKYYDGGSRNEYGEEGSAARGRDGRGRFKGSRDEPWW